MNIVKKSVTVVLILSIFIGVSAQDLLKMVPKEATYVGIIDANQLKTKGRLSEMMELPFMQMVDKEVAKDISRTWVKSESSPYLDFSKHGINTSGKAITYFVTGKEMFYGGMLFPITNQDKFKSFVKILTKDPDGEKIIVQGSYTKTNNRDLHILWNQTTALFLGAEINPVYKDSIDKMLRKKHNYGSYSGDIGFDEIAAIEIPVDSVKNEETEIELEEVEVVEETVEEKKKKMSWSEFYEIKRGYRDSIKQQWVNENFQKLINSRGSNSFASNTDFANYIKSNPEMAVFFDYALLRNYMTAPLLKEMPYSWRKSEIVPYLMSFYGDITVFAKFKFEQDAAVLSVDTKYGDKIGEILNNVKKKKISKKFLKYLNKDMMGYYAMGMDVEGVGEGMKKMLKKSLPEIPKYGKAAVNGSRNSGNTCLMKKLSTTFLRVMLC